MHRWIVFLSLDNFYVTAERDLHPELEKKAIVVVRGRRILDISPEAKQEGIHSGVSLGHLRNIPRISILSYDEAHYLPLYHRIWNLMTGYATKVEIVDFHVGFIELAQNTAPKDCVLKLKEELLESTQLKSRVGGGSNKLIARLSARWEMLIPEEEVGCFLLSVPIESLDWIDSRVIERLNRLGVSTVGEIKTIPESLLKKEFPKSAELLIRIGRGTDPSPVISTYPPEREEKVIELEGESNYRVLTEYLSSCSKELSKSVRSKGKEALELGLIFSEGKEEKRSTKKLIYPISSHEEIVRIVSQLLRKIWQGGEIYTIKIVLSQLRPRFEGSRGTIDQLDLLHTHRKDGLFKEFRGKESLKRIKQKYGNSVIGFKKRRRRMAELIFERKGKYLL